VSRALEGFLPEWKSAARALPAAWEACAARPQRQQVAWPRGVERNAPEQSLQIEDSVESAAKVFAEDQVGVQLADGVVTLLNDCSGAGEGRSREVRSIRLPIGVWQQSSEWKSVARASPSLKSVSTKFEIADGDLVELQAFRTLVEADAVDVVELRLLGVARVVEHGSGGDCGGLEWPASPKPSSDLVPSWRSSSGIA
jgi:hypothetical protein